MSEDPIRRAFDLLDEQAVPSPEFAEALFDRLPSEAKLRPAPPRPRRPRRPSVRPELRRAFTIAAALGIALIGTVVAVFALVNLGRPRTPAVIHPAGEPPTVTATIDVGPRPAPAAVGFESVWVGTLGNDSVSRIDPGTNEVIARIPGVGASGIAVGEGSVWVTRELTNTMSRIDPSTNQVIATIDVGEGAHGVAVGFRSVWSPT